MLVGEGYRLVYMSAHGPDVTAAIEDGVCSICGGSEFELGPSGRLSVTGRLPRCGHCRSLERHRALRQLMLAIPRPMLASRRALQFAPDGSIEPSWFETFEGSRYGGENSIDMQDVPRADGSYDFISLSHVIEFVPDDRRAFSELLRIGSDRAIVHITFASAMDMEVSLHYSEPHGRYGRMHAYGRDAPDWLGATAASMTTVALVMYDPVTELREMVHFFCRRSSDGRTIAAAWEAASPGSTVFLSSSR